MCVVRVDQQQAFSVCASLLMPVIDYSRGIVAGRRRNATLLLSVLAFGSVAIRRLARILAEQAAQEFPIAIPSYLIAFR